MIYELNKEKFKMAKLDLSLISLKGISKPLTKLIDSISKGIGEIYHPAGTVIQAYADAKALLILEEANGKKSEIAWRATERINFLEIRRQRNIDSIVNNAVKSLPQEVSDHPVDEDWTASFFDNCKDIGDEKMQEIWGKILAGEVENPGRFSRRTLSTLKTLSKEEADMFTRFCSFVFNVDDEWTYFIIPPHDVFEYVRGNGMTTEDEVHLKNIGLLSNGVIHHMFDDRTKIPVKYFGKNYEFALSKHPHENMYYDVASFPLTQTGNELLPIAGGRADADFSKLFRKTPFDDSDIKLRLVKSMN